MTVGANVGVLCVKRPTHVSWSFPTILLLVPQLAGLGAYDMCMSVVSCCGEPTEGDPPALGW